MKKFIAMLLLLTMCVGLFAGCVGGEDPTDAPQGSNLAAAKEYLYAMYKENNGTIVRRDFTRVAVVMIDGVSYNVSWSVDSSEVTISAPEKSMVTIDINEAPAEDVTFVLTATVSDAEGNKETVSFTHYIEAPKASGTTFVDVPAVETAYKFALVQNTLGQTLYFTGAMSGYYLAMSENPFEAVDVFVENVDGGQRIYFLDGENKTYIDVVPRGADQPGKVNVILTAEPSCVYTWDAERKTFTTKVEENTWYLGTYNTYNTISASNVSYIEDVTKIGDSQFPAGFCTVNITATQVATPAVDTAYKFALVQNNLGQTLYFTGAMSGYYLATSVNPAEGVNVFVENVDGGQRLYFMKGEVKTYIDVVPRGADQPGKVNVILTEEPTCVFTWDAERKTFTTKVEENTWYLGTYNTYNTISASNISYIEKVEVIGESQFPAGPYTVDGFMEMQPDFSEPEAPEKPEEPETPAKPEIPAADSKLSVKEVIDLGASMEHDVYTEGKYYVTGVITEIYQEVYGNMKITDAAGNILTIYGTFDADGTNRFDAMETKPVVGDTVTIYGIVGQYNGTPQIKNGWIVKIGAEEESGSIADGVNVKIYYPDGDSYVTGTQDGNKLAAGTDAEAAVWAVSVNADGYYTFQLDGKYLTSGETGNSVSLADASSEYSLWELIALDGGNYYIRNVGANYNGNYNQHLEFYNGFTTYGLNETKANIYTFQFVIVG